MFWILNLIYKTVHVTIGLPNSCSKGSWMKLKIKGRIENCCKYMWDKKAVTTFLLWSCEIFRSVTTPDFSSGPFELLKLIESSNFSTFLWLSSLLVIYMLQKGSVEIGYWLYWNVAPQYQSL